MNLTLRRDYIIGFIVLIGALVMVEEPKFEDLIQKEYTELKNLLVFSQFALGELPEDTFMTIATLPFEHSLDQTSYDTLVSRGMPQHHARFICNYFLVTNIEYPGNLCYLTTNAGEPNYSTLPQDFRGASEFFDFVAANHHKVIGEPTWSLTELP
jgi:hypothetical protein